MNDLIILGIETSGILCSVAWWQKNQILLEYNIERKNAHATLLARLVDDGQKKLNLSSNEIGLVAVGAGPGSFTGLRIGMAYAKGFCLGQDIPLIPVTNFEVLAYPFRDYNSYIFSLIEARNGYYYSNKFFNGTSLNDSQYLAEAGKIIDGLRPNEKVVVHEEISIGNFKAIAPEFVSVEQSDYRASVICSIGHEKYKQKELLDLYEVEPLYLQPFAGIS